VPRSAISRARQVERGHRRPHRVNWAQDAGPRGGSLGREGGRGGREGLRGGAVEGKRALAARRSEQPRRQVVE
jgi:hypothetical protein